jgi:hypothetical protein
MVDSCQRMRLGHEVLQRLQAHLDRDRLPPHSVEELCKDLEALARPDNPPFAVTTTVALIAELLLAEEAEIFPNELDLRRRFSRDKDSIALTLCLRSLREACFHPAAVATNGGRKRDRQRHIDALAARLDKRNVHPLAEALQRDYTRLRSELMAQTAIDLLDELGHEILHSLKK